MYQRSNVNTVISPGVLLCSDRGMPPARTLRSALLAIGWKCWSGAGQVLVFQHAQWLASVRPATIHTGWMWGGFYWTEQCYSTFRPICTRLYTHARYYCYLEPVEACAFFSIVRAIGFYLNYCSLWITVLDIQHLLISDCLFLLGFWGIWVFSGHPYLGGLMYP